MNIRIIMYQQDDPRKCTAAKMIRNGTAKRIKIATGSTILLDPFAKEFLLPSDRKRARSITAVDCSWRLCDKVFEEQNVWTAQKTPPTLCRQSQQKLKQRISKKTVQRRQSQQKQSKITPTKQKTQFTLNV